MSDYTKITDFLAKDALTAGDPSKLVLGAELDAEFNAIQAAVASKADDVGVGNVELVSASPLIDTAANTVAETAVVTTTVPANSLEVDSWIKYEAFVALHNGDASSRDYTLKVYVGNSGTDLVHTGVFSVAAGKDYVVRITVWQYGDTATTAQTQVDMVAIPSGTGSHAAAAMLGSAYGDTYIVDTVTLSSAQTFKITSTMSSAAATITTIGVDGMLFTMPSA